MEDAVIVAAARTAVGKFQGTLAPFAATELGAFAVREAVRRSGLEGAEFEECFLGNVLAAGLGQNPARQAALKAGLPHEIAAMTLNKVCGSGLKAVGLAAQAVATGNASVAVAGGMESMTNAPYLLPKAREGYRMGNAVAVDSMIHDGLWDAYYNYHMGITAENVAEKYGIARAEQDAFALESHRRAAEAIAAGRFREEIVPVEVPSRKKGQPPVLFAEDESVRRDTSLEALGQLKPAFKKDGTVTAGNAPGVSDAGAAVVVTSASVARQKGLRPLARIVAQSASGIDPQWVMMAPVAGVRKLLSRAGWKAADVELVELNEAFSVQAMAVTRELGFDPARVNVNGGAVAIGHPIGASGARCLVTLLYAMQQQNARRGVVALCIGGGNSVAMALERE
jgi:acetyl-CoA C-acetyltransferase